MKKWEHECDIIKRQLSHTQSEIMKKRSDLGWELLIVLSPYQSFDIILYWKREVEELENGMERFEIKTNSDGKI